jgi:hypothetical protein
MPRDEDRFEDEARPKKRRPVDSDRDDEEDEPRPKKGGKKSGGAMAKVIPYRNKTALIAYYCGIFAFIPVLNFVLGPIALLLGSIGLVKARKNPNAHGTGHAIAAILCGILAPPAWVVAWYLIFDKMTQEGAH